MIKKIVIVLLPFMCLFMLVRLVNNKNPFISSKSFFDYMQSFDYFNDVEQITSKVEDVALQMKEIVIDFDNSDLDILGTLKQIGNVALAFAKLIGLAILVIPAVLLDITQIVFWVIGFIPYVLSF